MFEKSICIWEEIDIFRLLKFVSTFQPFVYNSLNSHPTLLQDFSDGMIYNSAFCFHLPQVCNFYGEMINYSRFPSLFENHRIFCNNYLKFPNYLSFLNMFLLFNIYIMHMQILNCSSWYANKKLYKHGTQLGKWQFFSLMFLKLKSRIVFPVFQSRKHLSLCQVDFEIPTFHLIFKFKSFI